MVKLSASFFEGNEKYQDLGKLRSHEYFKHLLIVAGVPNIVEKLDKTNLTWPARLKFFKGFNVLAIGATNKYEGKKVNLFGFKNEDSYAGSAYGDVLDILAPGEQISSLVHTSDGCISDGVSEATAIVTGTLALLASCNPNATAAELRQVLLDNSDEYQCLNNRVYDGRVLNRIFQ